MIKPALPEHLHLIGRILKSGAAGGSWDPALQKTGIALATLLAKLQHAFAHGYVPQVDPRTGRHIETHIAGYVYCPEPGAAPIGFGLFKELSASGLEFWLLGIDEPSRGKGHARAMIAELLATPLGERAELARCAWESRSARWCSSVLKSKGFRACHSTLREEWLVHERTPVSVVRAIRGMEMGEDNGARQHTVSAAAIREDSVGAVS